MVRHRIGSLSPSPAPPLRHIVPSAGGAADTGDDRDSDNAIIQIACVDRPRSDNRVRVYVNSHLSKYLRPPEVMTQLGQSDTLTVQNPRLAFLEIPTCSFAGSWTLWFNKIHI